MNKKPLILTTGEPAGIGPDLCIQLGQYLLSQSIVLCGDINLLRERAAQHGATIAFHHEGTTDNQDNSLPVRHIPLRAVAQAGQLNTQNASYVLDILQTAAKTTLAGEYSGIVTAPIHKGIICDSGINFSGHTEFFAEQTQAKLPVMVLATEDLRVGLITTHLPLSKVPAAITEKRLTETLTVIHKDLQCYLGRAPQIGVCGLNPHAGEDGHMGNEEITIINPTLDKLRQQGLNLSSALPADTIFVPHHAKQFDIIVAMYHDQGLSVIKSQGFGQCVNLTLGLPIIRTSVDHGTALDLAGSNKASPSSLRYAIEVAKRMTEQHELSPPSQPLK